jgi:hypothetical protein
MKLSRKKGHHRNISINTTITPITKLPIQPDDDHIYTLAKKTLLALSLHTGIRKISMDTINITTGVNNDKVTEAPDNVVIRGDRRKSLVLELPPESLYPHGDDGVQQTKKM